MTALLRVSLALLAAGAVVLAGSAVALRRIPPLCDCCAPDGHR
jgi:hypothetical protein